MKKKKLFTVLIACVLCLPALALAADEEGYYSRSYARLNHVSGDVYIQRAGNMGFEAGVVNLPASEGDKLGTREGRVEVQFGGRNYLRVDRLTQVDFVNLPQQDTEPYKLHVLSGSIFLKVGSLLIEKGFEVHTPDASFYVLEEGLYRVNLLGGQQTELQVISGSCEAAGQGGSVVVTAQQRIVASNGNLRSNPEPFASVYDEFARWNESRETLLAQSDSQSYLPSELAEYGSEFDEYGTWSYEPTYGQVWVPRTSYYDWRPYYYGHWVWYPIIGWTWVSDEPWGWAAYHYGRWHWGLDLGWYWIPTHTWGPAWVNWWWNNDYIGWCPLNYYNQPVVIVNNNFYSDYNSDSYPIENRALTTIRRNQLQSPHIADVALGRDSLGRLGEVRLSDKQPGIAPTVERGGKMFREAQGVFSAAAGRKVDKAFGSNATERGFLNRMTPGSAIKDRSSVGREGLKAGSFDSSRSTGVKSNGSGVRETQSRNIRSYPSGGSDSRSGSVRSTVPNRSVDTRNPSASRSIKNYTSTRGGSATSRLGSSSSRESSALSTRRDSSSSGSLGNSRSIREFKSNGSSPVARFRSPSGSESSSRSSSSRQSAPGTSRSVDRPSTRSGSASSYSTSPESRSSSSSRSYGNTSRSYSSPSPSRSYSNSSRSDSSPSRSYSAPSRSYNSPSRSYSSPSRSYSSPSRSYSSPSRSYSSPSRSYSSPSRSTSSPSRSYSSPSRSSSGSSRSYSSSSRSSSSSSSSSSRSRKRD